MCVTLGGPNFSLPAARAKPLAKKSCGLSYTLWVSRMIGTLPWAHILMIRTIQNGCIPLYRHILKRIKLIVLCAQYYNGSDSY